MMLIHPFDVLAYLQRQNDDDLDLTAEEDVDLLENSTTIMPPNDDELAALWKVVLSQFCVWNFIAAVLLIMLIGVVQNTIVAVVATREKMRSNVAIILTAVSIVDSLTLLLCSALYSPLGLCIGFSHQLSCDVIIHSSPPLHMFATAAILSGVWLRAVMAIERWANTSSYNRLRSCCTFRRIDWSVVVTVVLCLLYCLPYVFEFRVEDGRFVEREWRSSDVYRLAYQGWGYIIVGISLPISIMFVCSLWRKLRQPGWQRTYTSRDIEQRMALKALRRLLTLYVILNTPFYLSHIVDCFQWQSDFASSARKGNTKIIVEGVSVCLTLLSISLTLPVCWTSLPHFADTLAVTLCPRYYDEESELPFISKQFGSMRSTGSDTYGIISFKRLPSGRAVKESTNADQTDDSTTAPTTKTEGSTATKSIRFDFSQLDSVQRQKLLPTLAEEN